MIWVTETVWLSAYGCVRGRFSITQHAEPQAWATNNCRSPEGTLHTRFCQWLTLTSLDCDISLSWVWVCRMRYAPICHSTSVLFATRTTLGHSGWWTMPNSWSAATCRVVGRGNMTQPHHPLHHPIAHSKHYSKGAAAFCSAIAVGCWLALPAAVTATAQLATAACRILPDVRVL